MFHCQLNLFSYFLLSHEVQMHVVSIWFGSYSFSFWCCFLVKTPFCKIRYSFFPCLQASCLVSLILLSFVNQILNPTPSLFRDFSKYVLSSTNCTSFPSEMLVSLVLRCALQETHYLSLLCFQPSNFLASPYV